MASPQKENGFVAISNEIMESLVTARMSGSEWQYVLCIIRKTYGFNKKSDWITNTQVMKMTGQNKQRVSEAKMRLRRRNMIFDIDGQISFNKDYETWKELRKNVTGVTEKRDSESRKSGHTKDTITKDTIQKTGGRLSTNKKSMAWKKYNENQHQDDVPVIDADTQTLISLEKKIKEVRGRGFTASDILELWNSYPTFTELKKKKGLRGNPKNPSTKTQLLPTARKTKDLLYNIGIMMKRYDYKDFEIAFENYMRELIHRSPKDSWAGKRYSLYELINPKRDTFKIYLNK